MPIYWTREHFASLTDDQLADLGRRIDSVRSIAFELTRELDELECEPRTVFVVFHETNTGDASADSDGRIEAVYATEADAQAARLIAIRQAMNAGKAVAYNPEDDLENEYWTDDFRVEAWPINAGLQPAVSTIEELLNDPRR